MYCEGCGVNLGRVQQMPESVPETLGNGRYRLSRLIGEGANKAVHLAPCCARTSNSSRRI